MKASGGPGSNIAGGENHIRFFLHAQNMMAPGIGGAMVGLQGLQNMSMRTGSYVASSMTVAQNAILAIGGAAAIGFGAAAIEAAKFQKGMAEVKAISGSTDSEIQRLGNNAKDLSIKYGMSMDKITDGLVTLGRAGLKDASTQTKVLEEGFKLAKLEGIELNDAIELLMSSTNLFSKGGMDSAGYANEVASMNEKLVAASQAGPLGVKDVAMSLKYVGGYAKEANANVDELLGTIVALSRKGVKGDVAGTALRSLYARPAAQTKTAVNALGSIGLSAADLWLPDASAVKDVGEQITLMKDRMDELNLSSMQQLKFWNDFAGMKAGAQLMKLDPREIESATKEIEKGANLAEKMDTILNTAWEKVNRGIQAFKVFMINVGEQLLNVLSPLIDGFLWFTETLANIPLVSSVAAFLLLGGTIAGVVLGINWLGTMLANSLISLQQNQFGVRALGEALGFYESEAQIAARVEMEKAAALQDSNMKMAQGKITTDSKSSSDSAHINVIRAQTAAIEIQTKAIEQQTIALIALSEAQFAANGTFGTTKSLPKGQKTLDNWATSKLNRTNIDLEQMRRNASKGLSKKNIELAGAKFTTNSQSTKGLTKSIQKSLDNQSFTVSKLGTGKLKSSTSNVVAKSVGDTAAINVADMTMFSKVKNLFNKHLVSNSLISQTGKLGQAAASGEGMISGLSTAIMGLASPIAIAIAAIAALVAAWAIYSSVWSDAQKRNEEGLKEAKKKFPEYKEKTERSSKKLESAKAEGNEKATKKYSDELKRNQLALDNTRNRLIRFNNELARLNNDWLKGDWGLEEKLANALGMRDKKISSPDEGLSSFENAQYQIHDYGNKLYIPLYNAVMSYETAGKQMNGQFMSSLGVMQNFFQRNGELVQMVNQNYAELSEIYNRETELISKYGSKEMARSSSEFIQYLNEMADATGMSAEKIKQALDLMETQDIVNKADQQMGGKTDSVMNMLSMAKDNIGILGVISGDIGDQKALQEAMITLQSYQYAQQIYSDLWWQNGWNTFMPLWFMVQSTFIIIWETIIAILEGTWQALTGIGQMIMGVIIAVQGVAQAIGGAFGAIKDGLTTAFGQVKNLDFGGAFETIKGLPAAIVKGATPGISKALSGAALGRQGLGNVVGAFDTYAKGARGALDKGLDAYKSGMSSLGQYDQMVQQMLGEARDASGKLTEAGIANWLKKNMDLKDARTEKGGGIGQGEGKAGEPSSGDGKGSKGAKDKTAGRIQVDFAICKKKIMSDLNVNLMKRGPLMELTQKTVSVDTVNNILRPDSTPKDYTAAIKDGLITVADRTNPLTLTPKNNQVDTV